MTGGVTGKRQLVRGCVREGEENKEGGDEEWIEGREGTGEEEGRVGWSKGYRGGRG